MEMENMQASRININPSFLDAALGYSEVGFNIFPIKPGSKIPIFSWKDFQSRKVSHKEITDWWSQHSNAGIAAVMGNISGDIVAVDIDPRHGGLESMKELYLPDTRIHKTGGNGFHYFYHMPEAARKKTGIFPGIDFIGEGGYCVMPPSIHESGQRYEILKALPIQEAPEWIIKMADSNVMPDKPEIIPVGNRHDSITRSVRGYAASTRHSFILLWKRAYALVLQCTEASTQTPFTFSELFNICLWAWNETHAQNKLAHASAWKMLAGRSKNTGDIVFGPAASHIHSFHLK